MFGSSINHSLDGDGGGGFGLPVLSPETALECNFNRFVEFNRNPKFREAAFYNGFSPSPGELVHKFLEHQLGLNDSTGIGVAIARLCDGKSKRLPVELINALQAYEAEAHTPLYHTLLSAPLPAVTLVRVLEQLLVAGYPTGQSNNGDSLFEYALKNNRVFALGPIVRLDVDPRISREEQTAYYLHLVEERLYKLTSDANDGELAQAQLNEAKALLRVALRLMPLARNKNYKDDLSPAHREMPSLVILFHADPTLRDLYKVVDARGDIKRNLFERERDPEKRKQLKEVLDWLSTGQAAKVRGLYGIMVALVEARCSLSAIVAVARTLNAIGVQSKRDIGSILAPHLNELTSRNGMDAFLGIADHADEVLYKTSLNSLNAELLVLLGELQATGNSLESSRVTKALTAPFAIHERGVKELLWECVYFLSEVGALTHTHRALRADTERFTVNRAGSRERLSLLELGGFKRVGSCDLRGHIFQRSVSTSSGTFTIEFSRIGIAASHPTMGHLFIRNSSPTYVGREHYECPAYYLDTPPRTKELLDSGESTIILKKIAPRNNVLSHHFLGQESRIGNALILSWAIRQCLARHAAFKCNTNHREITTTNAEGLLVPKPNAPYLHSYSPGFGYLLVKAKQKISEGKRPELAWVDGYPDRHPGELNQNIVRAPIRYYPFTGPDGQTHYTLPLTTRDIELLQRRIQGESSFQFRQRLHAFFRVGIEKGSRVQLMLKDWE